MPIYNYQCDSCQNVQEVITTGVNQDPKPNCEKCNSDKMTRIFSGDGFGFELKGEGWAKDGYQYEYTKSKAGEPRMRPVYSEREVKQKLEKMREGLR